MLASYLVPTEAEIMARSGCDPFEAIYYRSTFISAARYVELGMRFIVREDGTGLACSFPSGAPAFGAVIDTTNMRPWCYDILIDIIIQNIID